MIKLRLKKKLCVAITALLLTTMGTALASPLSESKNQLNKSKQLYNDVVKKVESLEVEIEKLDSQIEDAMADLDEVNKKITDSKDAIVKTEGEIDTIQKSINEEQKIFGERMEALYINGSTSYVDVLLEAESFSDFISKIDTVKTLIEYDTQIMKDLDTKKTTLASKKEVLEKEQVSLVALQQESTTKLATLNDKKKEQGTIIADLKAKKDLHAAEISSYQNEVERAIQAQQASSSSSKPVNSGSSNKGSSNNSSSTPSRGDGDASGMEIVNYARQFKGVPYVWGGTSPSGFDCSGLTSYVYRNAAGISLPRTSKTQANVGTYIGSKGSLQPGDLVFFGSPTHHVGIYTGNGNYIHAPQTGDVVKEVPMSRSDFTHGRRIL